MNAEKIAMLDEGKQLARHVRSFIDTLASDPDIDKRRLAIARTDLEKGFLALFRSITKGEQQ